MLGMTTAKFGAEKTPHGSDTQHPLATDQGITHDNLDGRKGICVIASSPYRYREEFFHCSHTVHLRVIKSGESCTK